MGLPARHAGSRPRPPPSSAGSRERMRAPTQAPLTTAPGALSGSQERTLWGRCWAPTPAPPTCPRRTPARSGGTHVTRCPSQWRGIPPREATTRATPTTGRTRGQQGLAARPTRGRPAEGERLTPDASHNGESSGSRRAHLLPSGRPAHVQGTPRGPGSNARHQPAKVYDAGPTSGSPTRTPPHPQHVPQNGPLQAQDSHRRSVSHPLLSGKATQQWRNPRPHAKRTPDLRR